MVAGKDRLDTYIGYHPQETDEDHPVGIISILLKERLSGKQNNYPDRVSVLAQDKDEIDNK